MYSFRKLYIDIGVIDSLVTRQICSRLKNPIELVFNHYSFLKKMIATVNSVELGKSILYLTSNRGNFIKKCPATHGYNCCNYFVIHMASFCFMDCSYCILQVYFRPPILQFFVNYDKLECELDSLFATGDIIRLGSGEFTDSLIWEDFTDISYFLVKKFSLQNKVILELKTKTNNIRKFKNLNHNRKTILSWSLNTQRIIESEEKNTASLKARLRAASKCEEWGYPLAFHLDPMVIYEGCEEEYRKVIELLFEVVSAENVVWISMGTLRFPPILKPFFQKRFKTSKIIYGEFVRGIDGKMRYFKPLRIKLYRYIIEIIRNIAPDVCLYFCMEDNQIWEESLGITVGRDNKILSSMLDLASKEKCNLSF